jgi:membrane protein implicated in regulation of membrane protease activity
MMAWVYDVLLLCGLALLGAAVWLTWGLAATVAYAGVVFVFVGVLGAWATVRGMRGVNLRRRRNSRRG